MIRIAALALMVAGSLTVPAFAGNGKAGCPPGLAKKAVPCVPPGQVKKWQLGERLPADLAWYEISDWKRYGLHAPLDGSRYVRVDNEILRVAIATGIVLEALGIFN